uniref:DUF6602 domain-containing protein n=1 Tax=uncultured Desulfobacterium sp. TaxID=201089 RepID=E1YMC0_9BACT|nr:hypothetical protein N47_E47650 [uncultured Desulfobacterium sp.]
MQEAFASEQKLLRAALEHSSQSISHDATMGTVNESCFIEVLRKYLPRRYAVDTGIVIDSTGNTSDQIDVIIYDIQYTPTLLDQKSHRYIPSEAIYAVFEVKPKINKSSIEYAGKKAESVRKLKRTSVPIAHAGGEFPPKKLFPIVAGIVASGIEWENGFINASFIKGYKTLTDDRKLDCGVAISGSCFDIFNGAFEFGPTNQALTYFLFRLLQKLQSLGTVPAIDWNAYALALSQG